jgi:peptide deformylase
MMEKFINPEEIAQLGHSILRQRAQQVDDIQSEEILGIIERMLSLLSESDGVGIAAPQIFESFCIVVIASRPSKRYPLAPQMEPVMMINPTFEPLSDEVKKDWEGCLSIPMIRALVPRYTNIHIRYIDCQGHPQEMIAEAFVARIFQHEYDHLQGLVYLDRVEDNKDIVSEHEFQKIVSLKSIVK